MQIHRFTGKNLREALQRARKAHGENAVVVGQEAMAGGGVTIAVVDESRRPAILRSSGLAPTRRPEGRRASADPGLDDVRRLMERHGASPDLVTRTLRAVRRSGAHGAYAIDVAASALGQAFPIAPSPRTGGGTRAFAFVGPTGVGKTTTLAKLAIRLVQAGRRVGIATMDTYRVAAVEQVQSYAELLQVPMTVARDGDELAEFVLADPERDVVLVDTTGRSPRDTAQLQRVTSALGAAAEQTTLDTYLVVSATSRPHDLDEAGRGFADTNPAGLVVTKLDETAEPTAALEYSVYAGIGLAFLCDGQDVREHLHRPHHDRLADLVLRGRIA